MAKKVRRPESLTVGEFFGRHRERLRLELLGSSVGFERLIREPTPNRPGLALAGYYTYFAPKRVQVIGNAERSYLLGLNQDDCRRRFDALCQHEIPCLVVARRKVLPHDLLERANAAGISVLQTDMITMYFLNSAAFCLEWDFAPTTLEHGCMVDVEGIGILIRGKSGSGKSETVLGLLDRGASLVADDAVQLRRIGEGELIGNSSEVTRFHMEVRGLGIINVPAIFGVRAVRVEKRLDMVINLVRQEDINELDRVGMKKQAHEILGVEVPMVEIPVAPGRDLAKLVQVAAQNVKLQGMGYDGAMEFDRRLRERLVRQRQAGRGLRELDPGGERADRSS